MINPQWLELPISGTNYNGPKDVQAIEVRLYILHYNEVPGDVLWLPHDTNTTCSEDE